MPTRGVRARPPASPARPAPRPGPRARRSSRPPGDARRRAAPRGAPRRCPPGRLVRIVWWLFFGLYAFWCLRYGCPWMHRDNLVQTIRSRRTIVSQTMWRPHKLSPRGPVYLAIADALAVDLEAERVRPGERLPTHRDLARALGVNVVTITRAYAEAARRGLVEGHVGRGTFVRTIEARPRERERRGRSADAIDLSQNQIALPAGSYDARSVLASMGERVEAALHAGYQPAGHSEHRAAGAQWIARAGLALDPEHVIVTTGGQ